MYPFSLKGSSPPRFLQPNSQPLFPGFVKLPGKGDSGWQWYGLGEKNSQYCVPGTFYLADTLRDLLSQPFQGTQHPHPYISNPHFLSFPRILKDCQLCDYPWDPVEKDDPKYLYYETLCQNFPGGPVIRLCAPNKGCPGSNPGWGSRFRTQRPRFSGPQLRPGTATLKIRTATNFYVSFIITSPQNKERPVCNSSSWPHLSII